MANFGKLQSITDGSVVDALNVQEKKLAEAMLIPRRVLSHVLSKYMEMNLITLRLIM